MRTWNEAAGPYLGAHMSVAGGVDRAAERARSVGARALQIFTKNSNQWKGKPIAAEEAERFRKLREEAGLRFAFSHDSYLINLASPDPAMREKSIAAFLDEMDRAEILGLDFLVFHPGSHVGSGPEAGCAAVSDALNRLIAKRPEGRVKILIENAAGQGTALGAVFEELARIREAVEERSRVGFCFDTCHAFAAGYDLRTHEAYEATMKEWDRICGLSEIRAFHLNDSKKDLGCRVDRHEHIGKGFLGEKAFVWLLNDGRFADRPMVIETEKSEDLHEDRENLATLRRLAYEKKG